MYAYEEKYLKEGYRFIAGTDEVGRGPMAGPLVCAAVVLDPQSPIEGLKDSKQLSEKKRVALEKEIKKKALAFAVVFIEVKDIDKINVYQASKLGMEKAVLSLELPVDFVLSDAMMLDVEMPVLKLIKGDQKSASIAAASILAKVARDEVMVRLDAEYPGYGFAQNKGYPTKEHKVALEKLGPSKVHRRSFKPVRVFFDAQMSLKL